MISPNHAPKLLDRLNEKAHRAGFTSVALTVLNGTVILVTGGSIDENRNARRWLQRELQSLGAKLARPYVYADGHTVSWTDLHEIQSGIHWGPMARAALAKAPIADMQSDQRAA